MNTATERIFLSSGRKCETAVGVFEDAAVFAAQKHNGMKRKLDGKPYILHPMEAALIASTMTADDEVLAAAVLHDVVEDTDAELSDIEAGFGARVAALVASETENKREGIPKSESWLIRKMESLRELESTEDTAVKILWLSDKLSNMRSLHREWERMGDEVWSCFNQKDPAKHASYYRRIAELLIELSQYDAWREYIGLVEDIFKGAPCEAL